MFGAGVVVGADVVDGVELGADVVDGVELGADEVVSVVCSGLVSTNGVPDVVLGTFEVDVTAEDVVLGTFVTVVGSGLVSTNGLPDVELKPFELVVGAEVVVLVLEPVVDDDTPNKLAIVEIIDEELEVEDVVVVVEEFVVEDNVDIDAF